MPRLLRCNSAIRTRAIFTATRLICWRKSAGGWICLWSFHWLFLALVPIELVSQIFLRAYAVTPKGAAWGKELALAFGARSHGRNLVLVLQD